MNINRNNYEEYFILYADNELSSDERRIVDEFILSNPDLKDELDIYLNTVLTTDISLKFDKKEDLHHYDESLISYIDNELPAGEKIKLEKLINESPSLQQELNLYRKTKLQPDADIIFENKSVLYRSTEKRRIVPMIRWAAAAAVLLAISLTTIIYFNKKSGEVEFAKTNVDEKLNPVTSNPAENIAGVKEGQKNEPAINPDSISAVLSEKQIPKNHIAPADPKQKPVLAKGIKPGNPVKQQDEKKDNIAAVKKQPPSNNLPTPQNNPNINRIDTKNNDAFASTDPAKIQSTVNGNKIEKSEVTNPLTPPLYIASRTNIDTELNDEETGKNKKSRGFFRKITRLFEKNTGIKATDDDKLRIAAFTVKL